MKKMFGVVLLVLVSVLSGYGQRISRVASGLDIGTGFASGGQLAPSFFYYQALHPAKAPWIEINGGVRVWSYFANDTQLGSAGNSKGDRMQLSRATATGISFVMGANLKLAKIIDVGVNADLVSLAFGKRRNALYRLASSESVEDSLALKLNGKDVGIAPANLNAVPFFKKNNNGVAEAFVRIWISPQIAIKAGYVWGQIAYRTDEKLNEQKRFSSLYQMPYVAITIPLYN